MSKNINRLVAIATVFSLILISLQCHRTQRNFVRDIDGNIYNTAALGDILWMTENLKSTRYNDGSAILCVPDQYAWLRLNIAAYCYYKNNESYSDTFGLMYNWFAVKSGKLCPAGWRVPTDSDWKQLEGISDTKFGIGDTIWNKMGLRGFDAGQRLKSATGWRKGLTGTDNLGFKALPGGERLSRFYAGGSSGFWWTSTEASESSAYYRSLIYSYEYVARDTHPKRMGFSVRCIKDKK